MKKLTIWLALILAAMFISCSDDSTTQPGGNAPINVISPLTVGTQWTYLDSAFDGAGNVEYVDSSKLGITGKDSINFNGQNLEVYFWNWIDIPSNIPNEGKFLCRNESDGLNMYGGQLADSNYVFGKSLWIKYPVNVNDQWSNPNYTYSESSFYVNDTLTMSCTANNEQFRTPMGNLTCYVYHYFRNDYDIYLYFSKSIGYVGLIIEKNGFTQFKKTIKSKTTTSFAVKNNPQNLNSSRKQVIYDQYGIKLN